MIGVTWGSLWGSPAQARSEVTPTMALSDAAIRAAKPRPAQYKLFDEAGLVLIVKPAGGKLWRL